MGAHLARSGTSLAHGAARSGRALVHDDAVALSLPWLAWLLSALFVTVAVAYRLAGHPLGLTLAALGTAAACAAVGLVARAQRIAEGRAHAVLSVLVLSSAVLSLLNLWVIGDPSYSTGVMLTVIGAGAGLVAARWVLGWVLAIWAGWITVMALLGEPREGWIRWGTAMVSATFLAFLVSTLRRRGIDALTSALARAEEAAVRDPLTGLTNRRGLEQLALPLLDSARRRGETVHCLFMDVDGLKQVNDSQGHLAGDELLVAVASALTSVTRGSDVVARWAGDEFCVMGLGSGMPAEELELRVRRHLREHLGIQMFAVSSLTAGRARLDPLDEDTLEDLLARADAAMYERRLLRRPETRTTSRSDDASPARPR